MLCCLPLFHCLVKHLVLAKWCGRPSHHNSCCPMDLLMLQVWGQQHPASPGQQNTDPNDGCRDRESHRGPNSFPLLVIFR